ncbi:MAG: family 43 glycosylhydrolase [Bacteroidaceae bacterium]|nr:family 43 glycosylhydrolase [Bacteroidaceae bacterium]
MLQTHYTADPAPLVVGDTVYLYVSHDSHPDEIKDARERQSAGFFMYNWLLYTSTDMVNWTDHGPIASLDDFAWRSRDNGAWAVQCVKRNGKYYLYCPLHGHGIGVLVADSPYGPFKDPLGKPLVWQREHWDDIDPTVFIDKDGQAWMYWGNPHTYYVRLNEDMISTQGEITKLDYHIDHYQEGPWLYERNNHWYLAYASTCCPEGIGYAMADAPTGPWKCKGYLMAPTPRDRGNHPGIMDFKGKSYLFGQDYDLLHFETREHFERRSVSVAEMTYNADGTIQEVPYWLDLKELAPVGTLNPYRRVEAETMAWGYGLRTEKAAEWNNLYVYNLDAGEYIRLRAVDFGKKSPRTFNLSAAAAEGASATISLHLDEPGGPLLGTVNIAPTVSIDTYTLFNTSIAKNAATGTHDLYLCIEQAKGDVRLDWWQFKK